MRVVGEKSGCSVSDLSADLQIEERVNTFGQVYTRHTSQDAAQLQEETKGEDDWSHLQNPKIVCITSLSNGNYSLERSAGELRLAICDCNWSRGSNKSPLTNRAQIGRFGTEYWTFAKIHISSIQPWWLAGLMGMFLLTPILLLFGVCVLLSVHRSKAVEDQSRGFKVTTYLVVFIVTTVGLYGLGEYIKRHIPQLATREDITNMLSQTIRDAHEDAYQTSNPADEQQHKGTPKTNRVPIVRQHAVSASIPFQVTVAPFLRAEVPYEDPNSSHGLLSSTYSDMALLGQMGSLNSPPTLDDSRAFLTKV